MPAARQNATAIVLAGGKSSRMGVNKSMLPLFGKPLIEHVCDQLRQPFRDAPQPSWGVSCFTPFDELLIAGGDPAELAFLGAPVVADAQPGQGPMRAIASALAVSRNDISFVIACDTPWVNRGLLRKLLRKAHGCDCVVPVTTKGHFEPLFAVYLKSMLPIIGQALDNGERRITAVFTRCRVKAIHIPPADEIRNINTLDDYRELMLSVGADPRRVRTLLAPSPAL